MPNTPSAGYVYKANALRRADRRTAGQLRYENLVQAWGAWQKALRACSKAERSRFERIYGVKTQLDSEAAETPSATERTS